MKIFEYVNDWFTVAVSIALLIGFVLIVMFLLASPVLAAMYILDLLGVIG